MLETKTALTIGKSLPWKAVQTTAVQCAQCGCGIHSKDGPEAMSNFKNGFYMEVPALKCKLAYILRTGKHASI